MTTGNEPFLQGAEVWVVEGRELRLAQAFYGRHEALRELSANKRLRRGEGLAGNVLSSNRATVWDELDPPYGKGDTAEGSRFDAALGIPIFHAGVCAAVVVLFCASREGAGGCLELWEANGLHELFIASGFYGTLAEFAALSALVRFPFGRGLPGITWELGLPQIIPDLQNTSSFQRASAAKSAKLQSGVSIPLHRDHHPQQVLLLIAATSTPLSRAFEVWHVGRSGALTLEQSLYGDGLASFSSCRKEAVLAPERDPVVTALATGLPGVFDLRDPDFRLVGRDQALAAGVLGGVALPIWTGPRVRAVATFFL